MNNKLRLVAAAYTFFALASIANSQSPTAPPQQQLSEALTSVVPNANLHIEGIPPVQLALAEKVARYTQFTGQSFVTWHPKNREMIVSMRPKGGSIAQLFSLAPPQGDAQTPTAKKRQLTQFGEPLGTVSFEPKTGNYMVVARGTGGNEAYQLYRLDLDGAASSSNPASDSQLSAQLLTNPRERHAIEGWAHASERLLFTSVPLDARGAPTGQDAEAEGSNKNTSDVNTRLSAMNPRDASSVQQLALLPGAGWFRFRYSKDDSLIVAQKYASVNDSSVWLLDGASGKPMRMLIGSQDGAMSANAPVGFKHKDGKPVGVYVITDRFGEFAELALVDIATGAVSRISQETPWNITSVSQNEDESVIAAIANVDGRSELRLFDGATHKPLALPSSLPEGSISGASFHKSRPELMLSVAGARSPGAIYTLDISAQKVARWVRDTLPQGLDLSDVPEQQVVRWKSFDERQISGILNLPPARFTGKRPVIITIHGGPEGQSRVGFLGRNNYYVNELGIAIIAPNVRGSTGYGKTFAKLDNGMLREDSVKDIGALLDWIATQPNLDASRVLVTGGSYGGYMALAVSIHYADRIAGAIDVVGISHFLTFLKNTESYRRDLRRVEYGDERVPAMREHLHAISPLTNAHKITKPLFVVQGKNDPRVPYTEAEQIVTKARNNAANSQNVWYLRADNEGHGFRRKENADFQFYATVMFLQKTLFQ